MTYLWEHFQKCFAFVYIFLELYKRRLKGFQGPKVCFVCRDVQKTMTTLEAKTNVTAVSKWIYTSRLCSRETNTETRVKDKKTVITWCSNWILLCPFAIYTSVHWLFKFPSLICFVGLIPRLYAMILSENTCTQSRFLLKAFESFQSADAIFHMPDLLYCEVCFTWFRNHQLMWRHKDFTSELQTLFFLLRS